MATAATYVNSTGQGLGPQAVAYAARYLGVPYVYGGTTPSGFDCSGLIQFVWDHLGVSLPRTSQEQASTGIAVPRDQLQPGDLIFYNEPGEGPNSHVAIYAGGGQEIEAPHTGSVVKYEAVDWTHFASARRVAGAVTGFPTGSNGVTQASATTATQAGLTASLGAGVEGLVLTAVFVLGGVALLAWGVVRATGGGS